MKNFFRYLILPVLLLASLSITACGGSGTSSSSGSSGGSGGSSGGSGGSGGSSTPKQATPNITITPSSTAILVTLPLSVTVTVGGGATTPTGSVVLSASSYTSSPTALSNGSAVFTIPANTLAVGAVNLSAAYTPDSNSSSTFSSGSSQQPTSIFVEPLIVPVITVTPSSLSIGVAQSLRIAVSVSGGTGNPTPTGSVVLSGGGYTSSAAALSSGNASFTIPANTFAGGSITLTATYTPDTASSVTYAGTTGVGSFAVTAGPAITSFTASQSTIVAGGSGTQLTAVFNGGTGVITPGASGGTTGSISVTSGIPVTVNPALTTTYMLTVTPTVGGASTQSLMLTVDPSISVCMSTSCSGPAISNLLLGMNLAVWYDDVANVSSIVSASKNAGLAALRWPGGSTSDDYHWNGTATNPATGVAPVPKTCNGAYQNSDTNYLSFIKSLEFADTNLPAGYDVALTADYGSNPACTGGGDPNEAANWVQYAYANGGTVSYVTVGNESYGSWEDDMHTAKHDPTTYASAVAGSTGYYDLIKAQVPSGSNTLVGVVVDANCTTANGCTNGWDSKVLSGDAGFYDFVEYHYYPQNPGSESDSFLVNTAPQQFTTNINTIKTELSTAGEPSTPIYVGEIGSVSSNPGKQSWSVTQGLYAGQILGEAMNDGVTRLTWWIGFGNCNGDNGNISSSLYGWQNFGAYNIFADGPGDTGGTNNSPCSYGSSIGTMSPTAEAFNLAQQLIVTGQTPQKTTVTGDTTDVRAYTATTAGGGAAIMLFNRNETTAETISLSLSSLTSSSDVKVTTYDKEMYDYTNTNCQADQPACTYDPNHDYSTAQWVFPTTPTDMGPQNLPLSVTLPPWSMTVVTVQP